MPDASHNFGYDLLLDSTGDLATVSSILESQQRILRRFFTNPGAYLWWPNYGGGILRWIGQIIRVPEMKAEMTAQMYLEGSVVQNPAPQINLGSFLNGVNFSISYVESDSNTPVTISANGNP